MKLRHSPVDDSFPIKVLDKIHADRIIQAYETTYELDISRFVEDKMLTLYRCEHTKLEFYRGIRPGDGNFYAKLMNFDWYYDPWKWEHEVVANMVNANDELVEIGSGSGGFLEGLKKENGCEGIGVEINEQAAREAKKRGVKVFEESLDSFAQRNRNRFDWSVSFQVLEHIENVGEFLSHSTKLLKPGGKLVVSVPNNDAFIGSVFSALNLPPHHMNRFTSASLKNIAPLFGLRLESMKIEPLQEYHQSWYINTILENAKRERLFKVPVLRGMAYRAFQRILENWVKEEASNIAGHSILAVYEKQK